MLTHTEVCLFCDRPDRSYVPPPGADFICGLCVQLLVAQDYVTLISAYDLAMNKHRYRQAAAIEMFLRDRKRFNYLNKANLKR